MLQKKAEDFAKELNHKDFFKASNGYIESFQDKHSIVFWNICGEGSSNFLAFVKNGFKNFLLYWKGTILQGFLMQMTLVCFFSRYEAKQEFFFKVTDADVENNAKCGSLYSWSLITMEAETYTIDNNSSCFQTHMFPTTPKSAITYPINQNAMHEWWF